MNQKLNSKLAGNTAFQNTSLNAKGSSAASVMHAGCLYPGEVEKCDLTTGMLTVITQGHRISNCRFMAEVAAAYIGVQTVTLPPPGTRVLVLYWPTMSYAMGASPALAESGDDACWNPPVTGDTDFDVLEKGDAMAVKSNLDQRDVAGGYQLPVDMVPGEWSKDTGIGPAFRLLLNFAQMTAGDLAKVEVHLINDMVRIIDNEFRHHHVAGDDLIWSDGWHANKEEHITSYCFEAEGKQDESETLADSEGEGVYKGPTEDGDPNMFSATGRWRLSTYKGFLGDMIHTWVTRPTDVVSNTMEESFRGCNFRQWIGQDGTYFVQAGMAVQIEVNPHQIVPAILKAYHDPEFNPKDQQLKLDSSMLKIWGKGPKWEDMKVSCWQMRTYLKYIPLWHSLERFRQMEKNDYCKIPTESEAPEYCPNADEEDKMETNFDADMTMDPSGYACLSMDLAGNVSLISNDDTSVILSNGSVQVAAPGNVEIKAGGTLSLQGQNVIIHSALHMEIISFFGGIYQKARTCWHTLCEKGRIWLKSDAEEDETDPGDCPLDDGPDEAEMKKFGVVIDAPKSKALVHGAKGADIVASEKEGHVILNANGANAEIKMSSRKDILMKAVKDLKVKCIGCGIGSVRTKFTSVMTKFGDNILFKGGSIEQKGMLKTMSVQSVGGYVGPSKYNAEKPPPSPDPSDSGTDQVGDDAKGIEEDDVKSTYQDDEFEDNDWKLPEWEVKGADDVLHPMAMKASLMEDYAQDADDMVEVELNDVRLESGTRTSSENKPWPGEEAKMFYYSGSEKKLTEMWDSHYKESNIGGKDKLKPKPYKYVFSKPDELREDFRS